jgi:hypothetical protein
MNKTTLLLLAIGGAILLAGKKLFGNSEPKDTSIRGQVRDALGNLGNQALAAIPPQYGFRAPAAAPLGGNRTRLESGAGVSVDITKLLKAGLNRIGQVFTPSGPHSTEADYAAVLAAESAQQREDARLQLLQSGFPVAPFETLGPGGAIYRTAGNEETGSYYVPAAAALEGIPGRNFSLEDGPLNSTEGPAEVNNPFLYDAPGGADFADFTTPQTEQV